MPLVTVTHWLSPLVVSLIPASHNTVYYKFRSIVVQVGSEVNKRTFIYHMTVTSGIDIPYELIVTELAVKRNVSCSLFFYPTEH